MNPVCSAVEIIMSSRVCLDAVCVVEDCDRSFFTYMCIYLYICMCMYVCICMYLKNILLRGFTFFYITYLSYRNVNVSCLIMNIVISC